MITPAYALTATERVLPRLALDFTTASLDARVAVTRALNTATCVNSNGLVEVVNANLPRFDFDPVTKICKGLLIEEARTNLLLYSAAFNETSAWDVFDATISPNAVTAPDGTLSADKLLEAATTAEHIVRQLTTNGNATYTYSVFVKAAERTRAVVAMSDQATGNASIGIDLTNGTTFASGLGVGSWTNVSSSVTAYPDSWYRVTLTATRGAGTQTSAKVQTVLTGNTLSYLGDVTKGIYVWGADLETGAFATSYIPTTTASALRNSDNVLMSGTNFSGWYNATEGTFDAQFNIASRNTATQINTLFCASAGAASDRITAYAGASVYSSRIAVSSVFTNLDVGTVASNQTQSVTVAYKQNSFASSANAVSPDTKTSGNIPAVDRLSIGNLSYIGTTQGYQLNGWMQRLFYWPQRLINAEVQAFSKV